MPSPDKSEDDHERIRKLHAKAAKKGWRLGKHPTQPSYMLVKWTQPSQYLAADLYNGYGYSLDEIEKIIEQLD